MCFKHPCDCISIYSCIIQSASQGLGFRMKQEKKGTTCQHDLSALQWRHNERDSVSNHQPHECLLYGLFRRRYQSSASLAFVRGIHRWTVNSPHRGSVTRKIFPFDDVIMSKRPCAANRKSGFTQPLSFIAQLCRCGFWIQHWSSMTIL